VVDEVAAEVVAEVHPAIAVVISKAITELVIRQGLGQGRTCRRVPRKALDSGFSGVGVGGICGNNMSIRAVFTTRKAI
jgi:hypothetical protein